MGMLFLVLMDVRGREKGGETGKIVKIGLKANFISATSERREGGNFPETDRFVLKNGMVWGWCLSPARTSPQHTECKLSVALCSWAEKSTNTVGSEVFIVDGAKGGW